MTSSAPERAAVADSPGRRRRHAIAGLALVIALLALVGVNLASLIRNQARMNCDYAVCLRPRRIAAVAAGNRHPSVKGRIATYHMLRRIAGATVTVPAWLDEPRWYLERVSRLHLVVGPAPLIVPADQVRALRKAAVSSQEWLHDAARRRPRVWRPLHLVIDPGATDYVVAETAEANGEVFVLSAARFAEIASTP